MPRMTRAAMRAEAETLNLETENMAADSAARAQTPTKGERSPLASIDSNSVDGGAASAKEELEAQADIEPEDAKPLKRAKSGKGKKGKGGKKAAKSKTDEAEDNSGTKLEEETAVEQRVTGGAAEDGVADEPVTAKRPMTQYDKLEAIVTTPPARLTRSQLAKAEELAQADAESAAEPTSPLSKSQVEPKVLVSRQRAGSIEEMDNEATSTNDPQVSAPAVSSSEALPTSRLDASAGLTESVSTDTAQDPQLLAVQSNAPSRSPSGSSTPKLRPEDSIDAIDAMEDAFEQVNKLIPQIDPTSPEKAVRSRPVSKDRSKPTTGAAIATAKMTEAFKARKAAATASVTATARKPSVTNRPAAPGTSRAPSSRPTDLHKCVSASTSRKPSGSEDAKDLNKSTDYLASRRRPISMQFPAPPPPAKSSKAPTKSTFTLPGEAVAAKLKAAREQRLRREEEEAKKRREFKARPIRNSMAPVAVKPTASSRARESLMHGSDAAPANNKENVGLKRSTIAFDSTAMKRLSAAPASTIAGKRSSVAIAPARPASSAMSRSVHGATGLKRSSMIAANSSKPRTASVHSSSSTSGPTSLSTSTTSAATTAPPTAPAYVAGKGREIFNRDRVEKERREQERKEKEDAAKKARLAAAERGRQASREWAEKMKVRKATEAAAKAAKVDVAAPMGQELEHARLKAL